MIIWLVFSIITLILAYLGNPNIRLRVNSGFFQYLLVIWLAWFVSFGGKAMQDQYSYELFYNASANIHLIGFTDLFKAHFLALVGTKSNANMEIGYTFLNILFNKLGFTYTAFIFILAIFSNGLIVKFIYRYKSPVFSILIFIATSIYSQQANLLRQMIAMSMFLYAIKFIETRNLWRYVVWILISSFIHASAILLILIYFIGKRKVPTFLLLFVWFASLLINYLQLNVSLLSQIRVSYYNSELSTMGKFVNEYQTNFVINSALLILIITKNNTRVFDEKYYLAFNLFFIGVVLGNLIVVSFYIYRFSLYFVALSIIVIPMIPAAFSRYFNSENKKLYKNLYYLTRSLIILFYLKIIFTIIISDNTFVLGTDFYSFRLFK